METVLIILGVLGFGAVLISAYVFMVAARNYVSDRHHEPLPEHSDNDERLYVVRSNEDRRHIPAANTDFPMKLASGEIIPADRRAQGDRRVQSAGQ